VDAKITLTIETLFIQMIYSFSPFLKRPSPFAAFMVKWVTMPLTAGIIEKTKTYFATPISKNAQTNQVHLIATSHHQIIRTTTLQPALTSQLQSLSEPTVTVQITLKQLILRIKLVSS
jgi:hypothetical protein